MKIYGMDVFAFILTLSPSRVYMSHPRIYVHILSPPFFKYILFFCFLAWPLGIFLFFLLYFFCYLGWLVVVVVVVVKGGGWSLLYLEYFFLRLYNFLCCRFAYITTTLHSIYSCSFHLSVDFVTIATAAARYYC